ncbi:HAD domain-containing protein [Vibrio sp. 10N.239.312.D08]|uniref:HAD domain-containing protein n=1 Tax=Vibrio sp. 10N.239.312.D08 TaxID=3229978 RepID=UPI00354B85EA
MVTKIIFWGIVTIGLGIYLFKPDKREDEITDFNELMPKPDPLFPVSKLDRPSNLITVAFNPNKPTIFIDIDGVFHRYQNESFECRHFFEALVEEFSELQFVLSSTWRHDADQEYLENKFGSALSSRLVGATPFLSGRPYRRQCEIEQFVNDLRLSNYIVIDDTAEIFTGQWDKLVLCDKSEGFSSFESNLVRDWLCRTLNL